MVSLTLLKNMFHIIPLFRVTRDPKGACTLTTNICMYIRRIQPSCLHQLFCCLFLSLLIVGSSPGLITSLCVAVSVKAAAAWLQEANSFWVFLFFVFFNSYVLISSPLNVLSVGFSFLQITRRSLVRIMAHVKRVFPISWRRSVEQTCFFQQ